MQDFNLTNVTTGTSCIQHILRSHSVCLSRAVGGCGGSTNNTKEKSLTSLYKLPIKVNPAAVGVAWCPQVRPQSGLGSGAGGGAGGGGGSLGVVDMSSIPR